MMAKKKKKLVLLDAHAILHRAYHALPDFSSSKGEPTGALYGLCAMLLKLVKDLEPDYIAACYDLPGPTYRHDVYKHYKAGRAKTDELLVAQLERSRDIFSAFSVPIYEKEGFEADDILGTIVEILKKNKEVDIVIASGDMDTMQLISGKGVQVYTLKKGINETVLYDEKAVEKRFGFKPKYLPDYKGLRGDPSDNIIGVKGIGEKTATALVQKFATIEKIYAALKKRKAIFNKIGIKERIIAILQENEEEAMFSKMLATIRRDAPIAFALPQSKWREHIEIGNVIDLFSELGFRTLSQRVKDQFDIQGTLADVVEEKEKIEEGELKIVGLALWLLHSETTNPQLDDILHFAKKKTFSEAKDYILKKLKDEKLQGVYEDIELPLIPVVKKMEERGVLIDVPYIKKLSKDYHKELGVIEKRIYRGAKGEFNINSPKQLGDILFEKLQIKVKNQKKTGTGQKSTRESELAKMKDEHPIINDILEYRELQKLLSTYIDNIPKMLDKDNRLHAAFLQTGTTTGRMSSQNPNLQNIPVRSARGRNIRNAFIVASGYKLVALDYSQIELRIAAILSSDEKLIAIFKQDGDVHRAVAEEVFGVPSEQVDDEMRRRAKVINFGIIYGMGVNALRQNLGTTRSEAQQFYNEYFRHFAGLARYLSNTKADTARRGFTETLFGRKRYFEGIRSPLPYIRSQAERMAINAPIQGTEADVMKIAMARIDGYLKEKKFEEDVHLLLQVHDELVYEVKDGKVDEVAKEARLIMESVLDPKDTQGIILKVDVSTGKNWGEMEKI
jgi:DNA polymerase I